MAKFGIFQFHFLGHWTKTQKRQMNSSCIASHCPHMGDHDFDSLPLGEIKKWLKRFWLHVARSSSPWRGSSTTTSATRSLTSTTESAIMGTVSSVTLALTSLSYHKKYWTLLFFVFLLNGSKCLDYLVLWKANHCYVLKWKWLYNAKWKVTKRLPRGNKRL